MPLAFSLPAEAAGQKSNVPVAVKHSSKSQTARSNAPALNTTNSGSPKSSSSAGVGRMSMLRGGEGEGEDGVRAAPGRGILCAPWAGPPSRSASHPPPPPPWPWAPRAPHLDMNRAW
jgi:hypothetical protein